MWENLQYGDLNKWFLESIDCSSGDLTEMQRYCNINAITTMLAELNCTNVLAIHKQKIPKFNGEFAYFNRDWKM